MRTPSPFEQICEALDMYDEMYGQGFKYATLSEVLGELSALKATKVAFEDLRTPRRLSDWDEYDGNVLWWRFPINEPPYVGTPLDDDFPPYVTHWTPLELPYEPDADL